VDIARRTDLHVIVVIKLVFKMKINYGAEKGEGFLARKLVGQDTVWLSAGWV
jgi:hypothetical protein